MIPLVKQQKTRKKVRDKWDMKGWYKMYAPAMFNNIVLGETLSDSSSKLIGRYVEATVQELTGDMTKPHIKLYFKIDSVKGNEASTVFVGQNLTSDYVRRLTRRRKEKIDIVCDVITKDNCKLRVKPLAVAEKRIQAGQEKAIREIIKKVTEENASSKTLGEFVKCVISGELAGTIFERCKVIYPLKRIEIRKTEVEFAPPQPQQTEIQKPPEVAQEAQEAEIKTEIKTDMQQSEEVKEKEESKGESSAVPEQ